jgi:hypothetical protein
MGKIDFAKAVQSDDAVEFKKHLDAGDFDEMSKSDWHRLIEDGAKQSRATGETREQAYTKFIVSDPLERELFRSYENREGRAMMKRVFG